MTDDLTTRLWLQRQDPIADAKAWRATIEREGEA